MLVVAEPNLNSVEGNLCLFLLHDFQRLLARFFHVIPVTEKNHTLTSASLFNAFVMLVTHKRG